MIPTVVLRRARPEEDHVVRGLAALDSAPRLRGEIYLALVGDRPVAALSMRDGRVVADPFVPSAEAVALLRELADRDHAGRRSTPRSRRRARPRLRPAT